MNLEDKISNGSSNNKDLSNEWKTILAASSNQAEILSKLREGIDANHVLSLSDNFELRFRLLTVGEESAIHCFVDSILNESYRYNIPSDKKEEIRAIEYLKVKLVLALSTPQPLGSSFIVYNANSQLKYRDLSEISLQRLLQLSKEYESLEAKFNPDLGILNANDISDLVEAVKKSVIQPKDLNYGALLSSFIFLIEQVKLEDKAYSAALSLSQSKN